MLQIFSSISDLSQVGGCGQGCGLHFAVKKTLAVLLLSKVPIAV